MGLCVRELALALLGLLGGCDGCDRERPYTPFGVASSQPAPAATAVPTALPPTPEPQAFVPLFAERAPDNATRWQLFGEEIEAPRGRVFQSGLRADFDGDGTREAVAWTLPASDASGALGELWLYPAPQEAGPREPRKLATLPGFVPTGPGCKVAVDLKQTGPRTVTIDAASHCESALLPRSPVRAIAVIGPARPAAEVSVMRLSDPAPGEELEVTSNTADRDSDGRDDVTLTFTLRATGRERPATAHIVFLDRVGGLSRDPREPAESLAAGATAESLRAKGKSTAKTVADGVANLRRLYATLCAESGVPRVLDGDGAPLRCGKLSSFIDRLGAAEVQAALTRGAPLEAVAVLARDGWYQAAMSDRQRKSLVKDIEKAVVLQPIARTLVLEARPQPSQGPFRLSPLGFDADGSLLVQTAGGLIRVPPDGSREEPITEGGPEPWPLEVVSPNGARITGAVHACDRSELLLTTTAEPIVTPLLAARPGPCAGGRAPVTTVVPIGWSARGLEAIVAGSRIGPDSGRARPGAPRSPDGHVVTATALGALVVGEHTAIWRVPELVAPSACVVANGARAVACVDGGRVKLMLSGG